MCFSSKILFYSNVRIEIGYFDRPGGMRECHAVLHVTDTEAPLAKQLGDIRAAYFYLLSSYGGELCPVFKRYFLSDAANQIDALRSGEKPYPPCATSVVQQPPLDGGKVALWVYLLSLADGQIAPFEGGVTADHNGPLTAPRPTEIRPGKPKRCSTGTPNGSGSSDARWRTTACGHGFSCKTSMSTMRASYGRVGSFSSITA